MRVYLKNGRSIRVNQETANTLVDMIIKGNEDLLIQRNWIFKKNIYLCIKIDEISAIK